MMIRITKDGSIWEGTEAQFCEMFRYAFVEPDMVIQWARERHYSVEMWVI
jgi:hypothetical protein